jgi:hypothetical protein
MRLIIRQLIMAIPSSQHPNYPLFHCVNKGWKEGSMVVFHFLPSNECEARMYISGLIAYLRATASPWYLELFKPTARARSLGTSWDPNTRQLTSALDSTFTDSLNQDPIYDVTNSTAALLSSYQNKDDSTIHTSIAFDVPITDGASLGFYKDTDSISTFRSNVRSALKKKKETTSTGTPTTTSSTPAHSVSFASNFQGHKLDDASVSKMSNTASALKVATLET